MSTMLINLTNRIITDDGEVIAKHELLVEKALSGEVFTELKAIPHPDINQYNLSTGHEKPIVTWEDTGQDSMTGPTPETFEWTIPKKYLSIDIIAMATEALVDRNLATPEYIERLTWELQQMTDKGMFPFVRCLLYVIDQFREKNVVWGVGRGSSCASLVMYLLRINKVDPVKYGIPAEEFFK